MSLTGTRLKQSYRMDVQFLLTKGYLMHSNLTLFLGKLSTLGYSQSFAMFHKHLPVCVLFGVADNFFPLMIRKSSVADIPLLKTPSYLTPAVFCPQKN